MGHLVLKIFLEKLKIMKKNVVSGLAFQSHSLAAPLSLTPYVQFPSTLFLSANKSLSGKCSMRCKPNTRALMCCYKTRSLNLQSEKLFLPKRSSNRKMPRSKSKLNKDPKTGLKIRWSLLLSKLSRIVQIYTFPLKACQTSFLQNLSFVLILRNWSVSAKMK